MENPQNSEPSLAECPESDQCDGGFVEAKVRRCDMIVSDTRRRFRIRPNRYTGELPTRHYANYFRGAFTFRVFCRLDFRTITVFEMPLLRTAYLIQVKHLLTHQEFVTSPEKDPSTEYWWVRIPVPRGAAVCRHASIRISHPKIKSFVVRTQPRCSSSAS